MFYLYVLRSQKTGGLYVGSTTDVEKRLQRHNRGDAKSTRHGVPWAALHTESFITRSEAVRRERYYKTGRGREEIQRLLANPG